MTAPLRSNDMRASSGGLELRAHWMGFLCIGILLDVLGLILFGSASFLTVKTVGWLLIAGGLVRGAQSLFRSRSKATFIEIATAILYVVVGILLIARADNESAALANTLIIAALLMLDGVLHVASSVIARYPNWRWLLVDGILLLFVGGGLAVWRQFTHTRVWVLAWILGITMLLNGGTFLASAWMGNKLPVEQR